MSDEYNGDGASHEEQTKVLVMKDSQNWQAVPTESTNLAGLLNQMNVTSGSASISVNGSLSTDYTDPITTGDQVVIISRNKSGG
jgi:sulfur carrier protein ThiS